MDNEENNLTLKNMHLKENFKKYSKILMDKKIQIFLTILLFSIILISSTSLRLQNLELLKDTTTGKYTSNDLDSLYFYRQAQTQLELGYLPEVDELRSPAYHVGWIPELTDNFLVWNYKILNLFNKEITFDYASALFAPILYGIFLIFFFIMVLGITKSKTAGLISCALLAYSPMFLFRSIAGFYDHDLLGVLAIVLLITLIAFVFKKFEKDWKNTLIGGLMIGFFTSFVFVSWGGAITFVLVFLPFLSFLYYLTNNEKKDSFVIFYLIWLISSIVFINPLGGISKNFITILFGSTGLPAIFVGSFTIIDNLLNKLKKEVNKKMISLYSLIISLILGIIGLLFLGKNPLTMFKQAWATLIYPFFKDFGGRLGATVAENSQPYLMDLISQISTPIFWLFVFGLIVLTFNLNKNIKSLKNKIYLTLASMSLLFAILCSRVSQGSILNGENFISQAVYLIGVIGFLISFFYVDLKEKINLNLEEILIFSLALTTVMNARAAIRSFFLIAPFIFLLIGYLFSNLLNWIQKNKQKESRIYYIILLGFIFAVFLFSLFGNPFKESYGNYQITEFQAKSIGTSVNSQWQNAMEWVRENTSKEDIFIHWWDYGYFIQTLANRKTVTDGGHSGGDNTDHYIGRYLLTTPNAITAYSLMKTWNANYLLIDPTEMGKYGAFSKIGSNEEWDRISTGISAGEVDDSLTKETSKELIKFYNLGVCVDQDLSYSDKERNIFLPGITITPQQQMKCNSFLLSVIIGFQKEGDSLRLSQPQGIFLYNDKQYIIPIKNLYYQNNIIPYTQGIDAVVYVIPRINEQTQTLEETGAVIYLSPTTFNSLMGKLYILNDPYKEFSNFKLSYKEDDTLIKYLRENLEENNNLVEFIYYSGLRAPLKIWKLQNIENISSQEQFLSQNFTFGGLDYLFQ